MTSVPDLFFYLVAVLVLGFSLATVATRNVFRAAVYLAVVLTLVAGLYLLLHAEFLAAVQVLVYVGAIIVLIIFAIMLTSRLGQGDESGTNRLRWPAFAALAVFATLALGLGLAQAVNPPPVPAAAADATVADLGRLLMTRWALPFELASVALLSALIGAMVLARKEDA